MAKGLPTFDAFSWQNLLAGRSILIVDKQPVRARRLAEALEEAGAVVTIAPGQGVGADRARDREFALTVLSLSDEEPVQARLSPALLHSGARLVILADPARHAALRAGFGASRIGDHSLSDRDLVLFVIGTADE